MNKRLLATVMSVTMIASLLCAIPVSAEIPGNLATDYVPSDELSGNMINPDWDPGANSSSTYVARWRGVNDWHAIETPDGGTMDITDGNWYGFIAQNALGNPRDPSNSGTLNYQNAPLMGTNVDFTKPATATTGNVVFKFQVLKDGSTESKVSVARRLNTGNPDNPEGIEYPLEYPTCNDSLTLTKGVISELKGTFAQVNNNNSDIYGAYSIGFPADSVQGARFIFNKATAYLGYEYPYDMAVSVDVSKLCVGSFIEADADILNQIGKDGDFDDSVTWYAMDESRLAVVEGFTIVNGTDGKATVSVDETVEKGDYYLVAVSNVNPDFVKGIKVEVGANPYSDYVPSDELTGNMISAGWIPEANYNQNNKSGSSPEATVTDLGNGEYHMKATRNLGHPCAEYDSNYQPTGEINYQGTPLSGVNLDFERAASGTTGNVVFSFLVKTDNEAHGTKVQMARRLNGAEGSEGQEYPAEYPDVDQGMTLSLNYQSFAGTFTQVGSTNNANYGAYSIGFPRGTVKDSKIIFKNEGAYLGYEYAYDIKIEADISEFVSQNSEITLDYGVINQVKQKGGLDQTVEFNVLSTDRSTVLNDVGIVVTDNGDGTATVSYDPFETPVGDYDIVVYSREYEMAKGVTITVPERQLVSNLELSDFSNDSVTATLSILNKGEVPINAVMIVIMLNDKNKIIDIETQSITEILADGVTKTFTQSLTASDLSKVTKAVAMVWDCGTSESPSMFNSNMKEIAQGIVKNK